MRGARRAIRFGAFALLFLVVALAVVVATVWFFPQVVVNGRVAGLLKSRLAKAGVGWARLDLSCRSASFWEKDLVLSASGLCYRHGEIDACAEVAHLAARVRFRPFHIFVDELSTSGVRATLDTTAAPAQVSRKSRPASHGLFPRPPELLKHISFVRMDVGAPHVTVKLAVAPGAELQKENEIRGEIALSGRGSPTASRWDVSARATAPAWNAKANLELESTRTPWFGPYRLTLDSFATGRRGMKANGSNRATASVKLRAGTAADEKSLTYDVTAKLSDRLKKIDLATEGRLTRESVDGVMNARVALGTGSLKALRADRCSYLAREEGGKGDYRVKVDCPIGVAPHFTMLRTPILKAAAREMRVNTHVDLSARDFPKGVIHGNAALGLDPVVNGRKVGSVRATALVEGHLDDHPKGWKVEANAGVSIPQFSRLVALLRGETWAIPAPLSTMKGSLDLATDGNVVLQGGGTSSSNRVGREDGVIPVKLTTRLSSPTQDLGLDGKGSLTLERLEKKWGAFLDLTLVLSDVRLELPRFGLAEPPPLFPDRRIRPLLRIPADAGKVAGKRPPFDYRIHIVTPPGVPVRLVSDVAEHPVPLYVNLLARPKPGVTGSVRIARFPVKVMNRRVSVKQMDIKLTPNPDNSQVNGEIDVKYNDYTIRILVLGLMKSPEIRFVSEPPLTETQAIAVLLFGKKIDALDNHQSESVASMSNAVADGAVTLASMYLLASTPVESIGYDPASRVVSARIRLASGTTLNVGSDMTNLSQLGIRKRLGPDWTITTYLSDPLAATRTLTAFLEWSKGY